MFKKVLVFLFVLIFTLSLNAVCFASDKSINVVLNGKQLTFEVKPQIIDDRVLVPMRDIFEALNFTIDWNEKEQYVVGGNTQKDILIKFRVNNKTAVKWKFGGALNSEDVSLDVAPLIINNRLFVPLRALSEGIGADVQWDSTTSTVTIKYFNKVILKQIPNGTITDSGKVYITYFDITNVEEYSNINKKKIYFSYSGKIEPVTVGDITSQTNEDFSVLDDYKDSPTTAKNGSSVTLHLRANFTDEYGNFIGSQSITSLVYVGMNFVFDDTIFAPMNTAYITVTAE